LRCAIGAGWRRGVVVVRGADLAHLPISLGALLLRDARSCVYDGIPCTLSRRPRGRGTKSRFLSGRQSDTVCNIASEHHDP
jgi:hypothetical protein